MAVNPNDKVFVINENINTQYGGVDPTGEFVTINDLVPQPVPQPYKVYTALLTQSGASNPVPTVLDNPDGMVINFSRTTTGVYTISSTSFIRGKVIVNNVNPYIESSWGLSETSVSFPKISTGGGPPTATREIRIPSGMYTTGTNIKFSTTQEGVPADDVLSKYNLFVEIRVYN
jgi:hypothetical protein